ncbi:hypothetical protein NBG4_30075 [Candidatus Sulfobium mesophilum]|uniref:Uncharacterized protein n=1 Tax=Candidatus Sulfobium mesophilum TaxID=2016548 RepID=A0A2U3QH02_9BACT|nr:hypothetical protein NBG4_30075 [Candidatus Sulfobium mesophilum]
MKGELAYSLTVVNVLFTEDYSLFTAFSGAGNGIRTRDPNLGKVVLYQLSYSRISCYREAHNIIALSGYRLTYRQPIGYNYKT